MGIRGFRAGALGLLVGSALIAADYPAIANTRSSVQGIPDGIYLYGEVAQPEQVGSAYMVFEAVDNQLTGAFFMPQSSFDCFEGSYQGDRLDLVVQATYENTSYPYSVAVAPGPLVASTAPVTAPVELSGFHQIQSISANDQRILDTCRTDF